MPLCNDVMLILCLPFDKQFCNLVSDLKKISDLTKLCPLQG